MTSTPSTGAYGFRIDGAGDAARLLNEAPNDWPILTISQLLDSVGDVVSSIGADSAVLSLEPEGRLDLDRSLGTATYILEQPLGIEAIVHPYLAPAAATHAAWHGWESYHAAGVVIDGVVWGIAGEREVGKSTLVAACARSGLAVMADDLLIVQGESVVAGPRTIDLREGAAEHFGASRNLGVTGLRERWRLDLDRAPLAAPFAGWIYPEWGDSTEIRPLPLAERLERPQNNRAASFRAQTPEHAMWMAGRPGYVFSRQKSWDDLESSLDALVEALT